MKLKTIIFFCLTVFSTCYSQQKEVTIISTSNFTTNDLNQLRQFESLLYGNKNKKQSDYKIVISSALDGISILLDNANSKNLLVRQSTNTRFNDEKELKDNEEQMTTTEKTMLRDIKNIIKYTSGKFECRCFLNFWFFYSGCCQIT